MNINEIKFQEFKNRWIEETQEKLLSSNPLDFYTPAYLDIIGMKYEALPCILNELVKEGESPKDWFYALVMITHINPVPREFRGNLLEMSKKWIEWGYDKGIIKPKLAIENLKKEINQKFTEKKAKPKKIIKKTKDNVIKKGTIPKKKSTKCQNSK